MSYNPFEVIEARLANIEALLLNLKPQSTASTMPSDFITRHEACEILGVTLPTILVWTKSGKIEGYRIGTRIRYRRSEITSSVKKIKSDSSYKK